MKLLEQIPVPGDGCPFAVDLLSLLKEAVATYGLNNVRVYISTKMIDGHDVSYLKICCYGHSK